MITAHERADRPALSSFADAAPIIRAMALRVSSPVLVGRGAELGVLLAALDDAASGSVRTVLVDGEAGIGKTRLVHELQAAARESGAIVLRGGCVRLGRDDGLPFAPVVEALRGLVRERGAADVRGLLDASTIELASLVPELGRGRPETSEPLEYRPDWAQTRLFEAVLVLLTRLGAEGPAIVVVEDLHWADRSTRDLFAFLSRNLRHDRILLIGTYRSDELHRRHPLRGWAGEMDRLDVTRVRLEPLGRDAVREQIEAITGERPSAELLDTVGARSNGNPFFVEELLAAPRTDELPASLRELLLARVATLPDEAQRLLGIAAVAGPTVDHDVLLEVAGLGDDEASPALREASAQHLIVPSSAGDRSVYTFRHALLQEAIYDDLLPRDRRRLHAEYARVFQSQPEPPGAARASHLAALAHHAEAAHDLPRALDAWLRAARAAFRVHAAPEATHAFSRCLDLWDAVPQDQQPSNADLVDVLYEASLALNGTGDLEKARAIAARAVELEGGQDRGRTALLLERLGRTEWLDGDLVRATATLEQATALLDDDVAPAIAARVVGGLAGVLMLRGQASKAVELARRALALARVAGSREGEAYALDTLGAALADGGDCTNGIARGREGLALARELDRADEIHRAYANLSTALEVCGQTDEAAELALEGVEWARRHGMWRLQGAFLEGNAASVLFQAGRWTEARALLATEDDPTVEGVALLNQAVTAGPLALYSGRVEDARRILTRARKRIRRLRDMQFTGPISVGLVELALADGRPDDAIALVDEALELMTETEDARYRAELMALAVRASAIRVAAAVARRNDAVASAGRDGAEAWVDRLRRFVADYPARRARSWQHARASLATAEAEVATLVGAHAAAEWAGAAAAWDDLGRPHPAALARLRQAEALLTAGDRAGGAEVLAEAHASAARIGAQPLRSDVERLAGLARVTLPAEPEADEPTSEDGDPAHPGAAERQPAPYALTDRELQILPLLVAGYTNRQIGEAMFISPSTAGVHVSRILGKMGVTSRVEAAALAVRAGLAD